MQSAAPDLRRLDELVLDHLANQRSSDAYDVDELATTGRFVRPYERVDIAPQRTFVKTIPRMPKLAPAQVTGTFDTVWFGASETSLIALAEPEPVTTRTSWWWLAISVAAGAAAVTTMYALL